MSDNSQNGAAGGGGINSVNQNVFGLTALIVAAVALATTTLQVLQQYYSSAEGYRRCARSVMGKWAEGTHRRLRLNEFRIEVVFETPVIFTSSPDNDKGPIKNKPIFFIKGTPESYTKTKVLMPDEQDAALKNTTMSVHTADDEIASWVTLLSTLQGAETQSRKWDESVRTKSPPTVNNKSIEKPEYGLEVQLQSKTRSWDFIPASISKPYATSAICHLVEMISMLGLYWKVFDQTVWNLRAEGNGFILTSTTVHGLGVMVVFATTGKSNFEGRRVIPCLAIKDLSFGTVANIFDDTDYQKIPSTQSLNLVFGANEDVSETLEAIGCSADTITKYSNDHEHIFSVSFEIIGMLGKVFRIRGSNFSFLPNPTSDTWLKKNSKKASCKIIRLMTLFQEKLQTHISIEKYDPAHHISKIASEWDIIAGLNCKEQADIKEANKNIANTDEADKEEADLYIKTREAIHDAIDTQTEFLLHKITQQELLDVVVAHITQVVDILDNSNAALNNNPVLASKEQPLIDQYFDMVRPKVIVSPKADESHAKNTIWISLVFRMLCWLLLHNFDQSDVKIVPSNLKGSRMPVFIG